MRSEGEIMFKHILIPIDGSQMSYRPVAAAIEMAKGQGGKLLLLSVAEPRSFNGLDTDALHDGAAAERNNAAVAQSALARAMEAAREAGIPIESTVAQSRIPCEVIVATAERNNCDVIFMATRGKMGTLDTLFDESTTQKVLQKTMVPVLVFP
jgi:nucleotide-binding universal stress UspA family protein